jgi:TetR/AcrR family transcriptional regulator, transcriptional repressor for nem operon
MRVSDRKAAEHRAALMEKAKKLVQEHGFDGAGVVEISREAGLTQGALYSQFGSKDALVAEACRKAAADGAAFWRKLQETSADPLAGFLDAYLADAHVNDVGSGCLMAACVSEMRRQDPAVAEVFAEGFRSTADMIREALPPQTAPDVARRRALAVLSALVGSVAMARALEPTDSALAKEVVAAARTELERLARGDQPSVSAACSPSE